MLQVNCQFYVCYSSVMSRTSELRLWDCRLIPSICSCT